MNSIETKTEKLCRTCNRVLPLTNFHKKPTAKDGVHTKCKDCVRKWQQERKKRRLQEGLNTTLDSKVCTECNKDLPLDKFNSDIYGKNGKTAKCSACLRELEYARGNKFSSLDEDTTLKKCNICSRMLPLKEFYKKNSGKYGRSPLCISCDKHRVNMDRYGGLKFKSRNSSIKIIKRYEETRESSEGFIEVRCTKCKKWFTPTLLELQGRARALEGADGCKYAEARIYCSDKCKHSCPAYKYGRLSPENATALLIPTSRPEQKAWAQMVLERDGHTCQKCGRNADEVEGPLIAHHKFPLNENPIESADIDVGITLCKECNSAAHKLKGCNTRELRCSDPSEVYAGGPPDKLPPILMKDIISSSKSI